MVPLRVPFQRTFMAMVPQQHRRRSAGYVQSKRPFNDLVLPGACFRHCRPGELLLTGDECSRVLEWRGGLPAAVASAALRLMPQPQHSVRLPRRAVVDDVGVVPLSRERRRDKSPEWTGDVCRSRSLSSEEGNDQKKRKTSSYSIAPSAVLVGATTDGRTNPALASQQSQAIKHPEAEIKNDGVSVSKVETGQPESNASLRPASDLKDQTRAEKARTNQTEPVSCSRDTKDLNEHAAEKKQVPPSAQPSLAGLDQESLEVIEVDTLPEKEAACGLHLAKSTFDPERELVKQRIFNGDEEAFRCRTWVLRQPPPCDSHSDGADATFVAAVTVRLNVHQKRAGRWAQILNMSTRRERNGFGTMLIAGLEELLRREAVDVVVLYPAWNGRAPTFWSSLGFSTCKSSNLPSEELVPFERGGPLLPETDASRNLPLPRWEKRINPSLLRGTWQPAMKKFPHRDFPASTSRLTGAPLQDATGKLLEFRESVKAELAASPARYPNGLPEVVAKLNNAARKAAAADAQRNPEEVTGSTGASSPGNEGTRRRSATANADSTVSFRGRSRTRRGASADNP